MNTLKSQHPPESTSSDTTRRSPTLPEDAMSFWDAVQDVIASETPLWEDPLWEDSLWDGKPRKVNGQLYAEADTFKFAVEHLLQCVTTRMQECLREFYEPFGITIPQAMVLLCIHRQGPGKITEIAQKLHMTNSNLSTICRRLERDHFLLRTRDDHDQRIVWVSLTDSCKEILKQIEQDLDKRYLANLSDTSHQDIQIILAGLIKLNQLLCREQPKGAPTESPEPSEIIDLQ